MNTKRTGLTVSLLVGSGIVAGLLLSFYEYAPLVLAGVGVIVLTTIIVGAVLIGMRMQIMSIGDVAKAISDTQVSNDKYDIEQMRMLVNVLRLLQQGQPIDPRLDEVIDSTAKELPPLIEDSDIEWKD